MKLNAKLLDLMHSNGVNESQLAYACNLDRTTLSKILNGHTLNPRVQTIIAFAKFFQIEVSDLFDEEDNNVCKRTQTLSQVLERLIKMKVGMSLSKLARDIGVTKSILSKILNNKVLNPHPSTLKLIADYFNVTITELTGYSTSVIKSNVLCNLTKNITLPLIKLNNIFSYVKDANESLIDKYINVTLTSTFTNGFVSQIINNNYAPYFISGMQLVVDFMQSKDSQSFIMVGIDEVVDIFNCLKQGEQIILHNNRVKYIITKSELEKMFIGTIIQTIL